MQNSKKMVRILMLTMVFVMMFSSVSMAAPMINLRISDVSLLDVTKVQAKDTFIIKDNVIVGIAPAMVGVRDKIMLPDTIDGVPVDVDYNKLAEYSIAIEGTRLRGETDYVFKEVKRVNNTAENILCAFFAVITIVLIVLMFLSLSLHRIDPDFNGFDAAIGWILLFTFPLLTLENQVQSLIFQLL